MVTAYRPDPVIDRSTRTSPRSKRFGEMTGQDVLSWSGYLEAHRMRRAVFSEVGATSTDHGHPTAATADLSTPRSRGAVRTVARRGFTAADAELFRAQMLTEMAQMSLDDGLVMQIHPGSFRNHNRWLLGRFGRDKGADIPQRTDYVRALKPLLDRFGNEPRAHDHRLHPRRDQLRRELAPLAGHYPVLKLGPAWWFHDSPEGMRRFREQTTETAGFYNTVGFNDDTRAFLSIPARHDVARRVDCELPGAAGRRAPHRRGRGGRDRRRSRVQPAQAYKLERSSLPSGGPRSCSKNLPRHPSRHDGGRHQRGAARAAT